MGYKTLLFHNGDYHRQAPLRFDEIMKMPMEQVTQIFSNSVHRRNTGVFCMTDTLAKNLDAEWISGGHNLKDSTADSVVTNSLHAISPTHFAGVYEYWMKLLDSTVNLVPLSCGFLYPPNGEVVLTRDLIHLLSAISERNEIGVRGEYAAEILIRHGIRNVRIIGCPSLFYHNCRNFKVPLQTNSQSMKQINFTFQTEVSPPKVFYQHHLGIFECFHKLHLSRDKIINWTLQWTPFRTITSLTTYKNFNETAEFLKGRGRYFFSVDDWIENLRFDDFSIGTTIHGNVAAINAQIPALPIVIDRRMEEICRWHKIPYIQVKDFDPSKPIEYYRELADYSEFNKVYVSTFDNYLDYCRKNKVAIKPLVEAVQQRR
ncbi:polysaccharide pyruvyl transferase [Desulfitobacterium sp. LBE]|uniref:polysaccharide pyruvyl transferase family protein n=1 Tax=Desulfitobacterium sp. LBE TaxID=884086 RepID=UPI00119A0E0F|nr:polysaccharide pyruvyl transferase family protein [Desulfitobacterium sp. LBE]TWH60041.1 polysaccharide pyruvyl transferase [Desulfitobacterium sp. LBE]